MYAINPHAGEIKTGFRRLNLSLYVNVINSNLDFL